MRRRPGLPGLSEVGYRSGHNGIASKAIGGSRLPRVQIPPPPLRIGFSRRRAGAA